MKQLTLATAVAGRRADKPAEGSPCLMFQSA